jgi:Glycolipid 2-alpha-mannosyltransferase
VFATGCLDPDDAAAQPRANAAFVVLARNKELDGVIQSVKSIERHFNRWFHYPYVFLNDGDFEQSFKDTITNYTSAPAEFGKIDPSMWGYPDWIDHEVAREGIRKQGDDAIMYGGMESYHHMCRFYSGFFYRHELLDKYEWYWRLEPEIKYFCDITYDPFVQMAAANKTYGFTIAVKELKETVPNIFRYASAYKRTKKLQSKGLWEMFLEPTPDKPEDPPIEPKKTLPDEILQTQPGHPNMEDVDPESMEGEKYNMCHFWSNFEIARLDWFRSKEYEDFFQMMDRSGGFWMERVSSVTPFANKIWLTYCSGGMLQSIPWPLVLFWRHEISITFETLATGIRPFNTVPQMPLLDSCPTYPSLRRPPTTRRSVKRKMTTGLSRIQSRRTGSVVDANATPISLTLKANRAAVLLSGLKSQAAGLPLDDSTSLQSLPFKLLSIGIRSDPAFPTGNGVRLNA